MKILLHALFALAILPASAQHDHSFTLVSTHAASNSETRSGTIRYSFEGARTAVMIAGENGQPDIRMVFDPEAKSIMQLHEINGLKGGFVFPMNETRWPGMPYSTATPDPDGNMAWTGKKQVIEGHECFETKVANEQYKGTAWIAKDIPLSMVRVYSYQSVGAGKSTEEAELLSRMNLSGFPLEMVLKSTGDGPDVTIRVEGLQVGADASLFNTEGYSTTFVGE